MIFSISSINAKCPLVGHSYRIQQTNHVQTLVIPARLIVYKTHDSLPFCSVTNLIVGLCLISVGLGLMLIHMGTVALSSLDFYKQGCIWISSNQTLDHQWIFLSLEFYEGPTDEFLILPWMEWSEIWLNANSRGTFFKKYFLTTRER